MQGRRPPGQVDGPLILDDWGESDRAQEPGIEDEIFDRLPDTRAFTCRLTRCNLTRWMGWLDAAKDHDSSWHSRAAAYLFMGIAHGWATKTPKGFSIQSLVLKTGGLAAKEPAKSSTGAKADPLQQARTQCQNGMHLSLHALLEPGFRGRVRMIVDILEPPRRLHGEATKHCRNGETTARYYAEAATGELWAPVLTAMARTFDQGEKLERWGVMTYVPPAVLEKLDFEHPLVTSQQAIAEEAGRLLVHGMSHIARGFLPNAAMYPGKLGVLGHDNPHQVRKGLHQMQADWAVWNDVAEKTKNMTFWPARLRRSMFSQPLVRDLFRLALQGAWNLTACLAACHKCIYGGLHGTKAVEDSFQRERTSERKERARKEMSNLRVWRLPVLKMSCPSSTGTGKSEAIRWF